MMTRITIDLALDEREALQSWAIEDLRPLKEQIRHILRHEAYKRGLLVTEPSLSTIIDVTASSMSVEQSA